MSPDIPRRRASAALLALIGAMSMAVVTTAVVVAGGARRGGGGLGMVASAPGHSGRPGVARRRAGGGYRLEWTKLETDDIASAAVLAVVPGTATLREAARLLALLWPQ